MRIWLQAARVRTLPAAVAPVLVGTAAAVHEVDEIRWGTALAALLGAIWIQIGTNLANDYSDAKRGADTVDRLGPVRITAQGLAAPRRVLVATWLAFAFAAGFGIYLAAEVGVEILAIGALSILAGVLYTGGPRPYGYEGLGEVFVFVFFGLVAVNGSYYVQLEQLAALPLLLSIPIGLLSTAILIVNNVRDVETDRRVGKRTLAVRLGRERARRLYVETLVVSFALVPVAIVAGGGPALALISLAAGPLAIAPARTVLSRTDGPSLNRALARSGTLLGAFSVLLAAGLIAGG